MSLAALTHWRRRVLTIGYPAVAVVDTVLAGCSGGGAVRAFTKSALMPLLALRLPDSSTGRATTALAGAGIGLSLVGDVALLNDSDPAFMVGLGAFLGGHLCYLAGFIRRGGAKGLSTNPAMALPAVGAAALGAALIIPAAGAMTVPVIGYLVAIGAMTAVAFGTKDRSAMIGAASFCASDFLLALNTFRGPLPTVANSAVMATYTAGQWLIVRSLTGNDR